MDGCHGLSSWLCSAHRDLQETQSAAHENAAIDVPPSGSLEQNLHLIARTRAPLHLMRFLFTLCATLYLLLYAFEGVARYGLYNIGHDDAILMRDLLLVLPLTLLLVVQAFRMRVHPAFIAFAAIIALHGAIARFNLGSTLPAIYRSEERRVGKECR